MEDQKKEFCIKLKQLGKIFEYYEYELPVLRGLDRRRTVINKASDDVKVNKSINRSRMRIYEYMMCNESMNKFLTLTYKKSVSYGKCLSDFRLFVMRLKRKVSYDLKYLAVPEYGIKNNRFHFHLVTNQPYIKKRELMELWGNGFIQINLIDDPAQIACYLSKYISKFIHSMGGNKKRYFVSKNLKTPIIYKGWDVLEYMSNNTLILHSEDKYSHPFLGTIKKLTYIKN